MSSREYRRVLEELWVRRSRPKRSDCPGGVGRFGFNTYSLLTMMVLGFNAVANVISNVNKNDNNNNNNLNSNDVGSVQGTSQDVQTTATSMSTVVVIVPPVGPPIPVVVGRAIDGQLVLDDGLEREDLAYLEDETDGKKMYLNGTISYRNGTSLDCNLVFGAVDPSRARSIFDLRSVLDGVNADASLTFDTLRSLNRARKKHRRKRANRPRDFVAEMLDAYVDIITDIAANGRGTIEHLCDIKKTTPFIRYETFEGMGCNITSKYI